MSVLQKIYAFLIDAAQTILLAASFFVAVYWFLFRPFQVNGQSMFPNFHDQQYVMTNLIGLKLEPLKRGDVIVFQAPTDEDKDFIKRVIGVPGDTVAIIDGSMYVNGQKLDESTYLSPDIRTQPGTFLRDGQSVSVPPNNYFAVGDNRPHSSDSREWGFVSMDKIIGKSMFIYWPISDAKTIKNPFEE